MTFAPQYDHGCECSASAARNPRKKGAMPTPNQTLSYRLVGAAAVALTVAILSSGCTATPSAETKPAASPSVSKPSLGDVIVSGSQVTDETGAYQRTTVNPKAAVFATAFSPADSTLQPTFSTADVLSAQQWVLRFVSEESTDSIALDSTAGWNRWKEEVAPKFVAPDSMAVVVTSPGGQNDRSLIIDNNANEAYPVMIRDGQPRVKTSQIELKALTSFVDSGKTYVHATLHTVVTYRLTKNSVVAFVAKATKVTPEAALATTPEIGTAGEHSVRYTTDWNYYLGKNGASWSILGYYQQPVGQAVVDPTK